MFLLVSHHTALPEHAQPKSRILLQYSGSQLPLGGRIVTRHVRGQGVQQRDIADDVVMPWNRLLLVVVDWVDNRIVYHQ